MRHRVGGYSHRPLPIGMVCKCRNEDYYLEVVGCTVNPSQDHPTEDRWRGWGRPDFVITWQWQRRSKTEGAVMKLLED